jgi:flagellar FliJ protein
LKKSMRLQPVRQLKQQAERAEAKKLAELQRELAAAKKQEHELQSYLSEYFQSVQNQQAQITQASQLGQYHAFIGRLQQAISRQGESIQQRDMAVKAQTQKWLLASSALKTMDQLIETCRKQESLEESKREQKQLDDLPFRNDRGF